ncbi:MAG: sulfite exporter TauE/SafE family protein [Myxococcales bacterium]|nr:sulfite exporter TauE/SafE family protein [Myxococcales bacterium]
MPIALYAIVSLAFVAEAITGFGGTVITVTLGAQLLPLEQLLPLFVPVNFLLSLSIAVRDRGHIAWPFLLRRMLPWVGLGTLLGMGVYRLTPPGPWLLLAYAVLVATLAALELWRGPRQPPLDRPPGLGSAAMDGGLGAVGHGSAQTVGLLSGGIVHGIYGSGGPLVVWATSRQLTEKSIFRATLAVLWLVLGAALMVQFVSLGHLHTGTLATSATLLPCLLVGRLVGNRIHRQIAAEPFRKLVYGLLLAGAMSLLVRKSIELLG